MQLPEHLPPSQFFIKSCMCLTSLNCHSNTPPEEETEAHRGQDGVGPEPPPGSTENHSLVPNCKLLWPGSQSGQWRLPRDSPAVSIDTSDCHSTWQGVLVASADQGQDGPQHTREHRPTSHTASTVLRLGITLQGAVRGAGPAEGRQQARGWVSVYISDLSCLTGLGQ